MFMKNAWLKGFFLAFFFLTLSFAYLKEKTNFTGILLTKEERVDKKVNDIIKENQDKMLEVQKKFDDKFVYLEFLKDDVVYSYYVNTTSGEITDFSFYIRPEKQEDFNKKITELLYLKYPVFIADALNNETVKKTYQIRENELVIYFNDVTIEPMPTEKLFLTVNYNEIKDCLDFTFLLDSEYQNEDGYVYDPNKKTVALTFDDGPSGEKTNQIVSLLEQNKAHATFFMVGNKMNYGASTIQNVLAKGNEIGSHSYSHTSMKRQKKANLLADEEKTHEIYRNITGQELLFTRPPYGAINSTVKESLDTIFITWNLDTEDWLHRDKEYIVNYVLENVHDGDIILMHDSYDSTVNAVAELLPKLYAEGYQVVSVSELAKITNHPLEKHTIYRSLKRSQ